MPVVALPNVAVEYTEYGDPSGSAVLLLHGFPDSAASWQPLIRQWQGEPVRFIAPMLRGYGASRVTSAQAETGEVPALASDAAALLEALGVERAVIVGHDWGARAAYAAAVLYPQRFRAVVALASEYAAYGGADRLPYPQQRAYWYQWLFQSRQGEQALTEDRGGLGRYLWETWSPSWEFAEEDFLEASNAWDNPQFVSTVLSYYRTRHGNGSGAPRYDQARARMAAKPSIEVPTWFMTGLADACNLPEGSRGQERLFRAGYERVEVPGVGHFIHREAPGAAAEVLAAALRGSR